MVGHDGCMWLYVAVCGCMWLYVAVCGCMWLYVAVCGYGGGYAAHGGWWLIMAGYGAREASAASRAWACCLLPDGG